MFILRSIYPEGTVRNEILGDEYQIVRKDDNKESWKESLDHLYPGLSPKDKEKRGEDIHSIVYCGRIIPLYFNWKYYIMLPEGKTFDNLYVKK
jgi:hypothetical protein